MTPPSASIPTITTERLCLRGFEARDIPKYAEYCADEEVMRYMGGGKPLTPDEAWRQVAFFLGHWRLRGYGQWAVEERSTGELVGRVGLHHPHGWPGIEVGWLLRREDWGRGFATEAARASLAFARDQLRLAKIISVIQPHNLASIRVAERLGGQFERNGKVMEYSVAIYSYHLEDTV